jgi:hypothetical protein
MKSTLALALLWLCSEMLSSQVVFRDAQLSPFPQQENKHALVVEHREDVEIESDSLTEARKRRLLPKNISLMERAFWGENGVFRATGIAPLTPESRKEELEVRRLMLTAHQTAGIATLGLMLATVIVGQRYIDGDFTLYDTKRRLGNATVIAYMTTAAFSLFSPPPAVRRDEWNTISTHKLFAVIHFTGMILTPILANRIASPSGDYNQKVRMHQTAAYITTAAFSASIISLAF